MLIMLCRGLGTGIKVKAVSYELWYFFSALSYSKLLDPYTFCANWYKRVTCCLSPTFACCKTTILSYPELNVKLALILMYPNVSCGPWVNVAYVKGEMLWI